MTEVMIAVVLLGLGTYSTRRAGVALGGSVTTGPRAALAEWVLDHAVIALLVAVALSTAVFDGHQFGGWARPLGVACALTAAWLRAPLVLSVLLGAGVTALARLAGLT
ncbi:AzlD domain-containing protein [Serinibacter salmoneus]|uniref:Branched-subunit amino acid transport protein AzlD n=1 Tax=Serinibacter salmoneus TaxID=556530 RepID=A0A2A9D1A4_9MICO|nr:AzlD domain-containing protein [Serinibacter salmoneus]PFG20146.1 branched-subunit amino acid transport protein AzlD [Serinibacter salmoneus]